MDAGERPVAGRALGALKTAESASGGGACLASSNAASSVMLWSDEATTSNSPPMPAHSRTGIKFIIIAGKTEL